MAVADLIGLFHEGFIEPRSLQNTVSCGCAPARKNQKKERYPGHKPEVEHDEPRDPGGVCQLGDEATTRNGSLSNC
jgi:hypothetical protein